MAREIVTHVWCDVCLHEDDTYTEAVETPPITLGNMKPRVLALCEVHTKDVFEPIKHLLTELGAVHDTSTGRLPGHTPGSGVFPCPDPNCNKHAKPFKHEQSLRNHSRQVHDLPINELRTLHANAPEGQADETLFEGSEDPPPAVTRAECDVDGCDKVYEWPEIRFPATALGVHQSKAHGIKGRTKGRRRA